MTCMRCIDERRCVAQMRRLAQMYQLLALGTEELDKVALARYTRGETQYTLYGFFSVAKGLAIPHFMRLPALIHVVLPSGCFCVDKESFGLVLIPANLRRVPSDFYLSICDFSKYVPCPSLVSRKIGYCPLRAALAFASGCLGCSRSFKFCYMNTYFYVAPRFLSNFAIPDVDEVFDNKPEFQWLRDYEGTGEPDDGAEYIEWGRAMILLAIIACVLGQRQ